VLPPGLNEQERAVWEGFCGGTQVDLREAPDRSVRAHILTMLLLGAGHPEPGVLPGMFLRGARIAGHLALAFADVQSPVRLEDCTLEHPPDLCGTRVRHLSLRGSTFPGLSASHASVDGDLCMVGCTSSDAVRLSGAHIAGSLLLDGAHLGSSGVVFDGSMLDIGGDIVAHDGFTCEGEFRLLNATVSGAMRFEGAHLRNPGGVALDARSLTVGTLANCCDGFRADGEVTFVYARIQDQLCLEDATLSNAGGNALSCFHLDTNRLKLAPVRSSDCVIDLRHARVDWLHDDSSRWPAVLRMDGLRYERLFDARLADVGTASDRLRWLRLDPDRYMPQVYEELAAMYRRLGRDIDARTVLLERERWRRNQFPPLSKAWGYIQDATVGYGYRPLRATSWLIAVLILGTVFFATLKPTAVTTRDAPDFNPLVYTLDLLLPVVDFGQERAFNPYGPLAWVAYALVATGWLLVTTITAGRARTLRRD
jgi:hypothetical protein